MANWWIGLTSQGAGDGSSNANRQEGTNANIQAALDQLTAGDALYLETGGAGYTITTQLDADTTAGSNTAMIKIIGVNSSGSEDGTLAKFTGSSVSTVFNLTKIMYRFKNLHFTTASGNLVNGSGGGNYAEWYNCIFANGSGSLINVGTYQAFINCTFLNGPAGNYAVLGSPTSIVVKNCKFINTPYVFQNLYGCVSDSIFHQVTNFVTNSFYGCFEGCIFDTCGTAISIAGIGFAASISNCRITNCTTGLTLSSTYQALIVSNNAFYNNGTDISGPTDCVLVLGSITLTGTGYVDQPNDDFTIIGTEGVGTAKYIGDLTSTQIGYYTSGIEPIRSSGGGGITMIAKAKYHGV